eukprot:CAMPEP_0178515388 /NCGR_PEP_ID=MMETSP0696-20121128/24531_1 /TAXON_ID=265572 /ORGANISM="Extubocellulus spinifer, Strain CCMP396" /LENGTH=404 /DNA_ID=CAMNT_0020145549 /DNA_START=122 /DNA_END=1336 /DNA_ORIENTATION=-
MMTASETPIPNRSRIRSWRTLFAVAICSVASVTPASSFANDVGARSELRSLGSPAFSRLHRSVISPAASSRSSSRRRASSPSALSMVWWFGGSEAKEMEDGDSCELVAVRIDRTSANSRRIGGEITVDRPLEDVWAILTDYDNLSVHVPNLVESRRVSGGQYNRNTHEMGEQGDGSYKCRLFQKGSQKIIGFQFAASVTMDMAESVLSTTEGAEQRKINFKCVDSQFFSEFDGDWTVAENPLPDPVTGEKITTIKYVVDVRPKGPVPVAALEWRIREDVPTNLRAVKKAAVEVGREGVMALRPKVNSSAVERALMQDTVRPPVGQAQLRNGTLGSNGAKRRATRAAAAAAAASGAARRVAGRAGEAVTAAANAVATNSRRQLAPLRVNWDEDETMAAYLEDERP